MQTLHYQKSTVSCSPCAIFLVLPLTPHLLKVRWKHVSYVIQFLFFSIQSRSSFNMRLPLQDLKPNIRLTSLSFQACKMTQLCSGMKLLTAWVRDAIRQLLAPWQGSWTMQQSIPCKLWSPWQDRSLSECQTHGNWSHSLCLSEATLSGGQVEDFFLLTLVVFYTCITYLTRMAQATCLCWTRYVCFIADIDQSCTSQLTDDMYRVRHEAGEALGAIGSPECMAQLRQHQHDPCLEVISPFLHICDCYPVLPLQSGQML